MSKILTLNGNVLINNGNALTVSEGSSNIQENKSYSVSSSGNQTINPDSGYDGMAKVSLSVTAGTAGTPTATKGPVKTNHVDITPSVTNTAGWISSGTLEGNAVTVYASELVYGTKSITSNGTNIDVTNYEKVDVNVSGSSANIQTDKSYTVSASGSQTIYPDSGYDAMDSVALTITAQSLPTATSSSASSGYTSKATISRSTADQYINIPTGYNDAGAYYKINAVANGSATGPSSISASLASVSTGTNTLTLTKNSVTTTPTVSAGYVSSATASTATVALTANVTTKAAATYYPSASDQTISASQYLTGAQTIKGVTTTNLTAANIKSGVTVQVGDSADSDRILSILGTYTGSGGSGLTLLNTTSLGSLSTSSTSAVNTNKTLALTGYNSYDVLIVDVSVDTTTNGRHTSTVSMVYLTGTSNVDTKNTYTVGSNKWNSKLSSTGTASTRQSTTAYGVYVNSASVSGTTMTLAFYYRYNSNSTGTLNGTYTARVYGLNLIDLVGG